MESKERKNCFVAIIVFASLHGFKLAHTFIAHIYIYLYIVIFDCGQRFFLLVIASAFRIGKPANILHIASCYKNASS